MDYVYQKNFYVVWRMGSEYHPDGEEGAYLSTIVTEVWSGNDHDCTVKLRNGNNSEYIQRAKGGIGNNDYSSRGWLYVFENQRNV